MVEIPQNIKLLLFGFGPAMNSRMSLVANLFAIGATVLGVISDVIKASVGLSASHWFLLAIILFIWGLTFWITAYLGAKEGYK